MASLISELLDVLPPPAAPRDAESSLAAWNRVFAAVGTRLPEDYVQFVRRYGTGRVGEFFLAYNPFAADPGANLLARWTGTLAAMASLRSDPTCGHELMPFPLYFEPGGLFPWGVTRNGEDLFWRTAGDPDAWTVVAAGRACGVEAFGVPMTRFLRGVVTREIRPAFLPDDFRTTPASFAPLP